LRGEGRGGGGSRSGYHRLIFWLALPCLLLALAGPARACTLWAAAGCAASDGGTLIAKNRDLRPQSDSLQIITPPSGYRYLGLIFHDGKRQGVTAGINERGLVIVGALAGSVPKSIMYRGEKNLLRKVLTTFDSVEAVAACREIFAASHPVFYMLADKTKIATVEVAPDGQVDLQVTDNGKLCHTNHYLGDQLGWANQKIGASSRIRLHRLQELVLQRVRPLSLEDFITISADRHDGPDHSIWRTGSRPTRTRTLATWIVATPKNDAPRMYVKLANPGEPEKIVRLTLDPAFWAKGAI
jgi:isopenicillin-N N-acyltransferase like protein